MLSFGEIGIHFIQNDGAHPVVHNTSHWVLKAFEWGSIKYEIFKSESIWAFLATNIIEQLVDEISTMKY